ncbi:related to endo-1,4-beta-xylanase b [Ustilago trichophora]|uniref:Beta-xylanase n=1 Tax=Ustilago trichophora TaxID=86804 RepID=A0A5C3EKB3_9BASI|nr:related to endo-1,4-beta-xylanase b [Ustilago trichophora]
MVSSKLALVLMLTAGGVMGRSSDNLRRLDRRQQPGGGGGGGGFGNGGADPLLHPANPGGGASVSATSGAQHHWATDASGMTGAELKENLPPGFFLGTSVDNPDIKDPIVTSLVKYLPWVTPGNALKMQSVYENENQWKELLDAVTKGAGDTKIKWKYHTLIWGAQQSKTMMQQSFSKEAMMKTITDFVTNKMCTKIIKETDFFAIDVLNEVFDDSGNGFKKNGYFEVIGEEGYKEIFKIVKQKCPNYKLIINDYGMESANKKSDFAFKTIKSWLADGVGIDAVGLQFHVQLNNKYEDMLASIQRWTKESIPVVLSEIDIPINLPPSKEDLEKQAQQYGNVIQAALEGGAFGATFWGMMDSHTWFGTQTEQGMGHGTKGAPLLFDAQGKPKPAVAAIVDVFKKWGNKQAGIEGGRATDLGGSKDGKDGSSDTSGDAAAVTGSGAGTGTDTGTDTGAGAGSGSGSGASSGAGSGSGSGSDVGAGSGSGSGTGSGSGSGSGSGASSVGAGSGSGTGTGAIDKGPADTGAQTGGAGAGGAGGAGAGADGAGAGGAQTGGAGGAQTGGAGGAQTGGAQTGGAQTGGAGGAQTGGAGGAGAGAGAGAGGAGAGGAQTGGAGGAQTGGAGGAQTGGAGGAQTGGAGAGGAGAGGPGAPGGSPPGGWGGMPGSGAPGAPGGWGGQHGGWSFPGGNVEHEGYNPNEHKQHRRAMSVQRRRR